MVSLLLASGKTGLRSVPHCWLEREKAEAGRRGQTWHRLGSPRERGPELECLLCGCLASGSCLPEERWSSGASTRGSDLQEGRHWELTDGSALADDGTLGPDGLFQPTTQLQRWKTPLDTGWTDTRHHPLDILPPFPSHSRFTERSVLPTGLCGRLVRYGGACRLKRARHPYLCVSECEITLSGALESKAGRAAGEARCPGYAPAPDSHLEDVRPAPPTSTATPTSQTASGTRHWL